MFTREQFLAGPKPQAEKVEIDGYGTVFIRAMSTGEAGRFQAWMKSAPPEEDILARCAMVGICDEAGALLLGESDLEAVKALDPHYLAKVQEEILRVNRLDADSTAADEKKA